MADALFKYETLDRAQVDDLMARKVPKEPEGWREPVAVKTVAPGENLVASQPKVETPVTKPEEKK